MKLADLSQLNEMPAYDERPLPFNPQQLTHVYSDATLQRDWTLVQDLASDVAVYLRNDKQMAVIGERKMRSSGDSMGLQCFVTLEFKDQQHLNNDRLDMQLKGALQVDMVETHPACKDRGFTTLLYTTLVGNGYTIISDNKQYFGGKMVWDSLVRRQKGNVPYQVNLLAHGQWVLGDNGKPLVYDKLNVPEDQIWGPTGKNNVEHYTILLVLRPR